MRDCLVLVGIERFPHRVDRLEPLGVEDPAELALNQTHSLDPGLKSELLGHGREGAVVAIEDVEQFRDEVRLRELRELGPLGLVALSVIREVGRHTLEVVCELLYTRIGGRLRRRRFRADLRFAVRPLARALLEQLLRASHLVVHQRPSMTRIRSLISDPTYRTAPMDRA